MVALIFVAFAINNEKISVVFFIYYFTGLYQDYTKGGSSILHTFDFSCVIPDNLSPVRNIMDLYSFFCRKNFYSQNSAKELKHDYKHTEIKYKS